MLLFSQDKGVLSSDKFSSMRRFYQLIPWAGGPTANIWLRVMTQGSSPATSVFHDQPKAKSFCSFCSCLTLYLSTYFSSHHIMGVFVQSYKGIFLYFFSIKGKYRDVANTLRHLTVWQSCFIKIKNKKYNILENY